MVQNAEDYTNQSDNIFIESIYKELVEYREGIASERLDGLNATAKNLGAFVQSVEDNGGYYIARYEASYGSGYNEAGSTDEEKYANAKPLSKISTGTPRTSSSTTLTEGMLWNYITQINAAKVARNMYLNNQDINGNTVGVESDLVNSYAWDTAIVYIQEMGHSNYANKEDENGTLKDTGKTGDVACNIYDMAANTQEWTTEYSTYTISSTAYPCGSRGGYYLNSTRYTAGRNRINATDSRSSISFRSTLYVK